MGFISRGEYVTAYKKIKAASLSGCCSVLIFVAMDNDAVCACKMLCSLFKRDYIQHKVHPVVGYQDLFNANLDLVSENEDLKFVIMLGCGSQVDVMDYLDPPPREDVNVYIIDSHRPWNLDNALSDTNIFAWDDGDIEDDMGDVRMAYVNLHTEGGDEDEEGDTEAEEDEEKDEEEKKEGLEEDRDDEATEGDEEELDTNKRASDSEDESVKSKRRKPSGPSKKDSMNVLEEYYLAGNYRSEPISSLIYSLASAIGFETNDILWQAIVALTSMEVQCLIPLDKYLMYYNLYKDEVNRLNPPSLITNPASSFTGPSIRCSNEFRFMLTRHWSLEDSMLHSPALGPKLRLYTEQGRRALQQLLAKIGMPLDQARQCYVHMDMDLKKTLAEKLDRISETWGLEQLRLVGFVRYWGFKCNLSASDVAYAMAALLDVGTKLNVHNKENVEPVAPENAKLIEQHEGRLKQFYDAYDALDNVDLLCSAMQTAMDLQRAVQRTGSSLIDKRAVKDLSTYRLVVLRDGPDLRTFEQPGALNKLALWLNAATRVSLQCSA